jgi:peptide deformylase
MVMRNALPTARALATVARSMARPPDPSDPAVAARRAAAMAEVRMWGDPVLRSVARPVDRFDAELREQANRMARLMDDALGAGLAANQVGMLSRLVVYRAGLDMPLRVLVNPEIEWTADEEEQFSEGCLSLPGVWVEVARPARVRVSACDENGSPLTVTAEGREASIVQHEIDHLDGVLVLDRLDADARRAAVRRLREQMAAAGR